MSRSSLHEPARVAPRRRVRQRRWQAAYTAVEVLMSMAVLAVGVVGIIATEKVTLASNMHAKNLAIATRIGETWLGILQAEAALWDNSDSLDRTTWLAQSVAEEDWFRPNHDDTTLNFGPAFDPLGNPLSQANVGNARYCVDLRVAPLTAINAGGGMKRAEVRVFWLRDQVLLSGSAVAPAHACSFTSDAMDVVQQSSMFHFVFLSTAVRQVGL